MRMDQLTYRFAAERGSVGVNTATIFSVLAVGAGALAASFAASPIDTSRGFVLTAGEVASFTTDGVSAGIELFNSGPPPPRRRSFPAWPDAIVDTPTRLQGGDKYWLLGNPPGAARGLMAHCFELPPRGSGQSECFVFDPRQQGRAG